MIVNQEVLAGLNTEFKSLFQKAFAGEKSQYKMVAMDVPSSTKSNTYGWLGRLPGMREWVGDRVLKNLEKSSYTISNRKFENTVSVYRTDIEDDNLGIYSPMIEELGRGAKEHADKLIFDLLKNGDTTICYDGQYFFDVDHPLGDAGVYSNSISGGGTPWFLLCTNRPVKPLIYQNRQPARFLAMTDPNNPHTFMKDEFVYGVDLRGNAGFGLPQLAVRSSATLDATGYSAARTLMTSYKDDHGSPLGIRPTLLVVPPSLEGAARQLLLNDRATGGATNEWYKSVELLVSPWLA